MEWLTFVGYWMAIALGGCIAHYVMHRRIDAEIAQEEQDETN